MFPELCPNFDLEQPKPVCKLVTGSGMKSPLTLCVLTWLKRPSSSLPTDSFLPSIRYFESFVHTGKRP